MDRELLKTFFQRYTNKIETMYRLPMAVDIEDFWPEELALRKKDAVYLPLHTYDGSPYYFNHTVRYLAAADTITAMARNDTDASVFADLGEASLIDEAYYSSAIEGAFSTREAARELIESGKEPGSKDERMILNNYNALRFVTEHLEEPIGEEMILSIGRILTEDTIEDGEFSGYRDDTVYVVSKAGEVIYTAPEARFVKPMMDELIAYMNDPLVHPVEKAVVSHVYFVTVHPFYDGNGRTARALTYLVLLKAGYDFFRQVPISGILAEDRAAYYKALRSSQDPANGFDFTYFTDYYTELLSGTLESVRHRLQAMGKYHRLEQKLEQGRDSRLLKGARWMAVSDITSMTAALWQKKFKVSFETARKDLKVLEEAGFLEKRTEGHKIFYDFVV